MKQKPQIFMNKPVYLAQSILEVSKRVMFNLWYNYVKPKYREKAQLCYMNTDSFIVYIYRQLYSLHKNRYYADIAKHVQKRFNTSN